MAPLTLEDYHNPAKPYSYASRNTVRATFVPNSRKRGGGGQSGGGGKSKKAKTASVDQVLNSRKRGGGGGQSGGGSKSKKAKTAAVDQVLHQSQVYTKFRQYKRPRQFLPIYVHEKREQFQMDIIYMAGSSAALNKGYKFVLSIIDCYTKFAWCYPLKRISGQGVVTSLRRLFSNPDNIPRKVHTDRGVGK